MHSTLVAALVVSLSFAFFAALMALRESNKHRHVAWTLAGLLFYLLGSAASILMIRRLHAQQAVLQWALYVLVVIGLVFWLVMVFMDRTSMSEGLRTLTDRLGFAQKVALRGWKQLDTTKLRAEDKRAASRISLALDIGAAIVVMPGIAGVLLVSIIMNVNGNKTSDFVAHAVGFYALLLATCWTVAYVLTILIVSIVQIVRGNGRQLTIAAVGISLGTWAGFGAAGGVFVGALVPLVVVPLAKSDFSLLGISLLDSISPGLLLEISAAGAIFGFLLGEVISLIDIADGEQNLYLKAIVPPLGFAFLASILGASGLSPGKLASELATEYNKTVLSGANTDNSDPFATALDQGLETQTGWASVVSGFEQHGWNHLVDTHVFYVATWVVAILVALFSFTAQVRKREEELLKMTPPVGPSQGGTPTVAGG